MNNTVYIDLKSIQTGPNNAYFNVSVSKLLVKIAFIIYFSMARACISTNKSYRRDFDSGQANCKIRGRGDERENGSIW